MEPPRRKLTAKASPASIVGSSASPTSSVVSSPQIVVRAKVSGSARTRTQSTISSPANTNGGLNSGASAVLRPQSRDVSSRSPSPAKMMMRTPSPSKLGRPASPTKLTRPASPSKLPSSSKPPVRATVSRTALRPPRLDHLGSGIASTSSTPSTPLPRVGANSCQYEDASSKVSQSGSIRVKAKVSSMAKPGLPPLSTMVSPPSPTATTATRPRVRTMTTTRRPSVPFGIPSRPASPPSSAVDNAKLIPLPTSPPASTLSFSSHSSTLSSTASYTTSEGSTPPISQNGHTRKTSLQSNSLHMQLASALSPQTEDEISFQSPPSPKRPLVARIRPGTQISRSVGGASGSIIGGGWQEPTSAAQQDNLSDSEESEWSSDGREGGQRRTASQELEDEERAEAKSNRKIADLEITTKSLLTINAMLEATKVRQAREIRDLRRKLRETRLAMPPKRFRLLAAEDPIEDAELADNDNEDSDELEEDQDNDQCFQRVKHILEDLLNVGRDALAVPAPSFASNKLGSSSAAEGEVLTWGASPSGAGGESSRSWKYGVAIGSRVLTAEEAKKWTGEEQHHNDEEQEYHDADQSHTDTIEDELEVERQVGGHEGGNSDDAVSATTQEEDRSEDTISNANTLP